MYEHWQRGRWLFIWRRWFIRQRLIGICDAASTRGWPIGPGFGIPFAQVVLQSICNSNGQCTEAEATASFSVEFTILGATTGALGLIDIESTGRSAPGLTSSEFSVGLPLLQSGFYEFVFGQPFDVSGSVQGGCSECRDPFGIVGSVTIFRPILIYDLSGELLDTIAAGLIVLGGLVFKARLRESRPPSDRTGRDTAATSEPVPSLFDAVQQLGLQLGSTQSSYRAAHSNSPRKNADGQLK